MNGRPKRDPWDVDAADFVPSKQAIEHAMKAFREGTPINCIQTAHMAKAANMYHPLEDAAENVVIAFDIGRYSSVARSAASYRPAAIRQTAGQH